MTTLGRATRAVGVCCALAAVLTACGGGGGGGGANGADQGATTTSSAPSTAASGTTTTAVGSTVKVVTATWRLPAPVAREVAVYDGKQIVVLGGFDASKQSTASVVHVDPATGASAAAPALPVAVHDAAGVRLSTSILVFAGGGPSENGTTDAQAVASSGATSVVGHLPQPRSDHVAAAVNGKAYVLGGFDGAHIVADVLSTTDGISYATVGTLPTPVRYPAVAVVNKAIFLFGGVSTLGGADTTAIQRLDTTTGKVDVVARLPTTLSHASAVVLGGQVFLLGGFVDSSRLGDQVYRFDPLTLTVENAGHLPAPLSDAAAVTIGDRAYLLGGQGGDRAPLASVEVVTIA